MTSTRSTVRDPGPRIKTGSTHCSLYPTDSVRAGRGQVGRGCTPEPAVTGTRVVHGGHATVDEEA